MSEQGKPTNDDDAAHDEDLKEGGDLEKTERAVEPKPTAEPEAESADEPATEHVSDMTSGGGGLGEDDDW